MTPTISGTLYHRPASSVRGDSILPLTALRRAHPDLYDLHAAKYAAQPGVLGQVIEPLGCTWGDVVFLSPVHPAPLFAALARAGRIVPESEPWVIPARRLNPARTVIRLMRAGTTGHHPDPHDSYDYLPFTTASLRAVNRVTVDAVQRLESLRPGDPWLPWVDVPHVLHRGEIPLDWFSSRPGALDH
ncbi:hypothetical protein [Ornithinimicrobium murale]|uniref:hypothetical protein n=1 Tax=Ornithinimicrobium murale TaxID=1050153 RepID=UPI0013B39EF3|nr:hypothetical protein [Ornithinimicrobium murale]